LVASKRVKRWRLRATACRWRGWSALSSRRRDRSSSNAHGSLAGSITIGEDFELSDAELDAMLADPE
jgi:hypothetical protein